ncbi:MAG: hypothetical protein UZ11_BCD004000838 [Bacteroidetes bacterium OLB11]|nr:MAG: hypothetical protein UZ11_BCD004000838 [Bacteroidetes bacterium OLB11]
MNKLTKLFYVFLLIINTSIINAQAPQLPAMSIVTEKATNKISWTNQYDGVKIIAVQRSSDSVQNFMTIGSFPSPTKGEMSYTDIRPIPGKNHYRVLVVFAGDVEWYSNTYKVILDSALIANSILNSIESGSTNSITNSPNTGNNKPAVTDFYYTPSSRVFTNPYTGHINIQINDATQKRYQLKFYTPDNKEVLRISRISKTSLILDKNNFNAKGVYSFKLFESEKLVESGYITIY